MLADVFSGGRYVLTTILAFIVLFLVLMVPIAMAVIVIARWASCRVHGRIGRSCGHSRVSGRECDWPRLCVHLFCSRACRCTITW